MLKLINKPVEEDLNLILDNYWLSFSALFPKVTKEQFINWIEEDYYGGWEELEHTHAGGRRELKMLYATIRAANTIVTGKQSRKR